MQYFGCRDNFAIEVDSAVDQSKHCQLDFFANGLHLNGVDNRAYVPHAVNYWPNYTTDGLFPRSTIFWEIPFCAEPTELLARCLADSNIFHCHSDFRIGPVSDSISMLTFGRPDEFVLLFIRNDAWYDTAPEPQWQRFERGSESTHWISVRLMAAEFIDICRRSGQAFRDLAAS